MQTKSLSAVLCALALSATSALAVTYVVPTDRELVHRSQAIVIATAVHSYTRLTAAGGVETVTTFDLDDVVGGLLASTQIDVVEPGGVFGEHAQLIPGAPQFEPGEHVLLFLRLTPQQTWAVTDLALGRFSIVKDRLGRLLATRDEAEVVGWDPDGRPHHEQQRSAERFLEFLRAESRGAAGNADYFVTRAPLVPAATSTRKLTPAPNAFTATSYTIPISGSTGSRWPGFPSPVTMLSQNTEPGAPGGGVTAIQAACSSWSNRSGSNANLSYGGATGGTGGLETPDGKNTVIFERDLTSHGIAAFSCSSGGVLGIGGITNASSTTNMVNGETFDTTLEGDVEMNQGIANCTSLFTSGDWNTAVTHEVGHTMGFRHSDQTRSGSTPCSSDPTLECSSSAVMRSSIPLGLNGALQTWDLDAVVAVYPGASSCTPPTITAQPTGGTINSGQSLQLSVAASGTTPFTYFWYIGNTGDLSTPAPGTNNASTYTASPTQTTTYWVRVTNSCNHADSNAATVTVNAGGCTAPSITTQPSGASIMSGQSIMLSVTAAGSATLQYQWYVGTPPNITSPVPGGTNSQVTVSPTVTTSYWVRVSNTCGTATADSNAAIVQVTATCTPPTIINDPPDQQITSGSSTSLFVGYSGSASNVTWYRGIKPDTSNQVGTGQTFITGPLTTTTQYWALVSNSCGSAQSRTVTVSVLSACVAPAITSADASPKNVTAGQSVTLTAQATGTSLQYQWYRGIPPDLSNPVAGANTATATDMPPATTSYFVRVTNSCGAQNSAPITVTVGAGCTPPSITGVSDNTTISSNTTVTLTVAATGDPALHYQWYRGASGTTGDPVGADSASFTTPALFSDTQFWVRVSNACAPPASSRTVNVTVIPARHRASRH